MRTAVLGGLGALALLLAGCSADPAESIGNAAGGGDGPRLRYVALGDSYTAAPGIGGSEERLANADGCFRSADNYPHQLAEMIDAELVDVSCSGATTLHTTQRQNTATGGVAPQLEAVVGDTDLVTVRLGANDFNLFGRVVLNCVTLFASDPTGSPCSDADADAGADSTAGRILPLQQRVEGVLAGIRERAPDAAVVVVGYPQVVPTAAEGGCEELPLPAGDLGWARDLNVAINTALAAAATSADATFVDVFSATEGHDICGDDPWIAGFTTAPNRAGLAWHPYVEEQQLVAELVEAAVD